MAGDVIGKRAVFQSLQSLFFGPPASGRGSQRRRIESERLRSPRDFASGGKASCLGTRLGGWIAMQGGSSEEINYPLRLRSNERIWMTLPSCNVDLRLGGCWVSVQSSQASRPEIYALLMTLGTSKWLIVTSTSSLPMRPEDILKQ